MCADGAVSLQQLLRAPLHGLQREQPDCHPQGNAALNHPGNHWFDLADFQIRRLIFYLNPDLDGVDQARVTVDGNKIVCKG